MSNELAHYSGMKDMILFPFNNVLMMININNNNKRIIYSKVNAK